MAEQPAGERTEEATPRRREQARKKGTVAKSTDLNGAIVMFMIALFSPMLMSATMGKVMEAFRAGLNFAPSEIGPSAFMHQAMTMALPCLMMFGSIAAVAMVTGTISNVAQVGFVLSLEALQPNLEKLNPMAGLKRLFSLRSGIEGLKAIVKSLLFGTIAFQAISVHWPELVNLAWLHPQTIVAEVGRLIHDVFLRVSVSWLVIAALDYFFQRKQTEKQLKMTRDELKQEMKEMEGSPEVKAERMARARRLRKGNLKDQVKSADAIITNPTHFSVAIKYKRNEMHAPIVVAKGQDLIALRIRQLAKEHEIAIVPNPPLARQLYKKCEVGDFVPRDLFGAVAEILAFVYSATKGARRNRDAA